MSQQPIETTIDHFQQILDTFTRITALTRRLNPPDAELTQQRFQSTKIRFEDFSRTYSWLLHPRGYMGSASHRTDVSILWSELLGALNVAEEALERRVEAEEGGFMDDYTDREGPEDEEGGDSRTGTTVEEAHDAVVKKLDLLLSRTETLLETNR